MRTPLAIMTSIGLAIAAVFPRLTFAQAPTPLPRQIEREVPTRVTPGQAATAEPTAAPAPDAPPTTAAAAPDTAPPVSAPAGAPVTQVTGPSSGVTTLPTGSQATSSSAQAATASNRSYAAAAATLTIEGQAVETRSLEGGVLVGELVTNDLGPGNLSKKHLSNIKVEPITIQTGLDSKPLMDWIAQTWKGTVATRSGSILITNYAGTVLGQRDFANGLISETTVPELNGSSKAPGLLTVKIAPERLVMPAGVKPTVNPPSSLKRKAWLASNFRFEMEGLDASRVAHIGSFTVLQEIAPDALGTNRDPTKHPARLVFPDLQISLAESGAKTWTDWYQDFVVNGNHNDDKERNGAIVFLGPDQRAELGRISLYNCGILRLAPDKVEANADRIRRLTANLYCERMELEVKNAGT